MTPIRVILSTVSTALILGGCASGGGYYTGDTVGGPGERDWRDTARQSRDPLLDAPYHAEMTCTTEAPVTVLRRMKEVPFACRDVGVSATVDELRDAGWRVVSLDIGEDIESDSHVGFPVTILIRKLF